jgi:hypothetical protein
MYPQIGKILNTLSNTLTNMITFTYINSVILIARMKNPKSSCTYQCVHDNIENTQYLCKESILFFS